MFKVLLLVFSFIFFNLNLAWSVQIWPVAFRSVGQWQANSNVRLDISLWYPAGTKRAMKEIKYDSWRFEADLNGGFAKGKYPLIILSHSSFATRVSYYNTAAYLASVGFIVAAPAHASDNLHNMENLYTWTQLERRVKNIKDTLDILANNKDLATHIDFRRVGLIGYNTGAIAAILLAGAVPDCARRTEYCLEYGVKDAYCNQWSAPKLDTMCAQLPLHTKLIDERIKAIVAITPGFSFFFDQNSMQNCKIPTLLIAAENEKIDHLAHAKTLHSFFSNNASLTSIEDADAGAFLSPCPESLSLDLPDICKSVSERKREAILDDLHDNLYSFFETNLIKLALPAEAVKKVEQKPTAKANKTDSDIKVQVTKKSTETINKNTTKTKQTKNKQNSQKTDNKKNEIKKTEVKKSETQKTEVKKKVE